MLCRSCHQETGDEVLIDLGMQPLANSLGWHPHQHLNSFKPCDICEKSYPLAPIICKNWHCRLIQLPPLPSDTTPFTEDYPYRSGQSQSWKDHLAALCAEVRPMGHVVEVGGNDGTLNKLLPPTATSYLNIDPTAPANGQRFLRCFMRPGLGLANQADYVFALNVAAHVPDLDAFFAGIREVMKENATLIVEVQDVNKLIERGEWDCIYHEHYSYFNRSTLCDALERRGFFVSKTEDIRTHGGSVRVYAHKNNFYGTPRDATPLRIMKPYPKWPTEPYDDRDATRHLFRGWKRDCKRIVGYGAPAKANTWINYVGLGKGTFDYIVDSTPEKGLTNSYTPGSHIPIVFPVDILRRDVIERDKPDIVVILAWNWKDEILPKIPEGPEVWCKGKRLR